jgi:signal transduction histidine kinase
VAGSKSTRKRAVAGRADLWLLARHDFRQPVQTLELLSQGIVAAHTEEERRRYQATIAQLAATIRGMEASLTLLAQAESGAIEVSQAAVPLDEKVILGQDALLGEAGRHNSPFINHFPVELAANVIADDALLSEVVRGILIYAVKFAESGEIALAIERRGTDLCLDARFRGVHPETALSEMAFVEMAPGNRLDGRSAVGLGPALAARAVRLMGGELVLVEGARDIVHVRLMLAAAHA